ncbi:MAG TPA: alkaline phosphatase PhoX [Steroidobacteraceae bacterium]|nr:alkaline phosphatase PhoX [Steroidobacteraceae bacterium]
MTSRRQFTLALTGTAFAGLLGACASTSVADPGRRPRAYGELVADPEGLLDLPAGFSYRVISAFGDRMDDGMSVPDYFDGMGCFPLGGSRVALVRNHELQPQHQELGPLRAGNSARPKTYDRTTAGGAPLPGGTTSIVFDLAAGRVVQQHLSLLGTIRNCAGGATPWGSWLTCEESTTRAGTSVGRDHGWVFEVPAAAREVVEPVPLTALGRFNHEAAVVDPRTGIVYLTEDRGDSLLYRLLPTARGELRRGGRLQALALLEPGLTDSRNWEGVTLARGSWQATRWIDLDNVESPDDDLRRRGHARSALLFARGEGIHMGDGELYFCCTSGGPAKLGQVMRYRPSRFEGQPDEAREPGRLQNFVESDDPAQLNYGDNLTVAPNGHLIVCEDQGGQVVDNHLRGVTPAGALYGLARLRVQTELAGACFSPDGSTMFVNVFSPGRTLAITGPWRGFAA